MGIDSKRALLEWQKFSDRSPGQLVPVDLHKRVLTRSGAPQVEVIPTRAFVPNALPPDVDWKVVKADLFDEFTAASAALGRVNGLVHAVPNTEILRRALWLREAKFSSKIEGIHTTALDMVLAGEREDVADEDPAREAWNAMRAVQTGLESELPYCGRLIREMHRTLLRGVRGEHLRPGEYRDGPVYIGPPDSPEDARFVPPPSDSTRKYIENCMAALERFVNKPWPEIPDLAVVAMSHYQFECIHPFRDGNGRISRALILHQMCSLKLLDFPIVSGSGYFQRHRQEYVDRLLAVSVDGDWPGWIRFFTMAIATEAAWTRKLSEYIVRRHAEFADQLRDKNSAGRLLKLLDHVFAYPLVSATGIAKFFGVTYPTARSDIDTFVELGILRIVEKVHHPMMWYSPVVLEVAEKDYGDVKGDSPFG